MQRHLTQALEALRGWGAKRWLVAVVASVLVALVLGFVTVLIPNSVFGRAIPPTSWSYPVWIVTALLSGMIIATYIDTPEKPEAQKREERSWWAMIGAFGAWFAIGCPVCNKIALLALGYAGAIKWFAPAQPYLAAVSLLLLVVGLVYRLSGMVACPVPKG